MRPHSRRAKQQANAITAQEFALCNGSDDSDDEKLEFVPGMEDDDEDEPDFDDDDDDDDDDDESDDDVLEDDGDEVEKDDGKSEDAKAKSSLKKPPPSQKVPKARSWEPSETESKSIEGYLTIRQEGEEGSGPTSKVLYTDDDCYKFESEGSIPASWSLQNPATTAGSSQEPGSAAKAVLVWQWHQPSGNIVRLDVHIASHNRRSWEKDSLHQRLLQAQSDFVARKLSDTAPNGKQPASKTSSASLKAPPTTDGKVEEKADATGSGKNGTLKVAPPSPDQTVYTLLARERTKGQDKLVEVSGVFLPPEDSSASRIYMLGTVKVVASTFGRSAAAAAAAAAPRKRRRGAEDDDDSVGSDGGVDYSELIHLHEDAHMSTEELRRKYYGGGGGGETSSLTNSPQTKKAKLSGLILKKPPPNTDDDDDDDADDDNYGF